MQLPRIRARAANPLVVLSAALVAYLALVPLGYLLWGAFFDGGGPTLRFFTEAYETYGLGSMALNSLAFAVGSTALAIVLGTALAFLVVRTDIGLRPLAIAASVVPLIVPGILYTIAWIMLASPRSGALAEALPGGAALDVFGLGGMIFVEGLHLAPLAFLLMAAALGSMDASVEEAAVASGARLGTVLRRVTLPLVRPALVAAALVLGVRALESFEVPALLGIPDGLWVFTSRIWRSLSAFPPELGEAGAYSVSLLLLCVAGLAAAAFLTRRGRRFEVVTGGSARPRRIALGRWRRPLTLLVAAYFAIAVVLPVGILAYASVQPFYSAPSAESFSRFTLAGWSDVLGQPESLRAFLNSLVLAVGTATAVMFVMAVIAWVVVRTRARGRLALDGLTLVPLAIPGLVLGVALVYVYLRLPIPVYATLWILFIAYFTRFMPYGMRFAGSSMRQIGGELEDAARASGAGWWQTFRRVLLPLLLPGLLAGWLYVVIVSMRELATSILLYAPGTEVLSVRIFELYESGRFTEVAALGVLMMLALTGLVAVAYRLSRRLGLRELGAP